MGFTMGTWLFCIFPEDISIIEQLHWPLGEVIHQQSQDSDVLHVWMHATWRS